MRIVVLGGYGNFGARICRALCERGGAEVIAAGRDPDHGQRMARLDFPRMDFLTLADFETEFKCWQIRTVVREGAA